MNVFYKICKINLVLCIGLYIDIDSTSIILAFILNTTLRINF